MISGDFSHNILPCEFLPQCKERCRHVLIVTRMRHVPQHAISGK
ncbi:hypothetical protein AC46_5213 [Escherichia coli 2-222-05_S3_C3]|nr:hypothetical protein AC46_5213 [Escherichia coli 2-222-05_S3_C3]